MNADKRLQAKLVSMCLRFPDEGLLQALTAIQQQIPAEHAETAQEVFASLLPHISNRPLIDLQEEYTRLFDLSSKTCMNLSYHKMGDSRKRGNELVRLKEIFREEGLESKTTELPDFLPMVLEFLSVCSKASVEKITGSYRNEVAELAARVGEFDCSYSEVFRLAAELFEPDEGKELL